MKPPHIATTLVAKGVTYRVMAYRKITRTETIETVAAALKMMPKSKLPKRGQKFTIHTVLD
jgi:hypothetical protein